MDYHKLRRQKYFLLDCYVGTGRVLESKQLDSNEFSTIDIYRKQTGAFVPERLVLILSKYGQFTDTDRNLLCKETEREC